MNKQRLLSVNRVRKAYENGLIPALDEISLTITRGSVYAVMGPSGCGKSTLLNIIGTLDLPDSGSVDYAPEAMGSSKSPDAFRNEIIGFVFQFHHLLPALTLQENVEIPMLARSGMDQKARHSKAAGLLDDLGLAHKKTAFANKVSGGERQRAAIARALANDPLLILADEPTGSVDSKTAVLILEKLIAHAKALDGTLIIATHDAAVAAMADTIIRMKDGKVIAVEETENAGAERCL